MLTYKEVNNLVPENIRTLVHAGKTYKIAEAITGLDFLHDDNILYKVAQYLEMRNAQRRAKWASIRSGLRSLLALQQGE